MAHYLLMASYTPETLREMVMDPSALVLREQHAEQFYGSLGGKVQTSYFIKDGEYHFMIVVDFPNDRAAHAAMMVGQASGAFATCKAYPLATFEEAKGALDVAGPAAAAFFAPGEDPK